MLNRIEPLMPAGAYKTYEIACPIQTHFRSATCAETGCRHHADGWRTVIDESVPLGQAQAYFIRRESGRSFAEHRDENGLTVFTFEAGQRCFRSADHKVSLERPEIYVVRGGDWRANPTGEFRRHVRPGDWVDDFATHQQMLADEFERG